MSSLNAVKALRDFGAEVLGMVAIFSYNFQVANTNFASEKLSLHTLSDYDHLLVKALEIGYISEYELDTLKEWRKSPDTWKN